MYSTTLLVSQGQWAPGEVVWGAVGSVGRRLQLPQPL